MDKKEIRQYLDQGYLQVNIIFEIVGNPKEYVSEAMRLVMKNIAESKKMIVVSQEIAEPVDVGEGLWGTNCETQILFKDLFALSILIFTYIPSSIEIVEPAKLVIKDKDMSDFLQDIATQLHNVNTKTVQTNSQNMAMLKNINALMRNLILVALAPGEKTAEELARLSGVEAGDMESLLSAMLSEKTIKKEGDSYARAAKQ
jgi:hypothetical protein